MRSFFNYDFGVSEYSIKSDDLKLVAQGSNLPRKGKCLNQSDAVRFTSAWRMAAK